LHLMGRPDVKAIAVPMVMEDGRVFPRISFIRNEPGWAWQYGYHEELTFHGHPVHAHLLGSITEPTAGPHLRHHPDGARTKSRDKHSQAEVTCQCLWNESQHPRYLFYGAEACMLQSKSLGAEMLYCEFLDNADAKAMPPGFRYYALLQLGRLALKNESRATAPFEFLDAYALCPTRAEALGELALFHARQGEWALCRLYALTCANAPEPQNFEYVEPHWRAWRGLDLLITSLLKLGQIKQAADYLGLLLSRPALPASEKPRLHGLAKELQKMVR
jgi:hypothetical protein